MKKICFIINKLSNGGSERVVSVLTTALENEYDLDLILNSKSDRDYKAPKNIYSLDIDTGKGHFLFIGLFIKTLRRIVKIRKIKRKNNYDVSVSLLETSNIVNYFSRTKNEKIIVSVRNHLSSKRNTNFFIVRLIIKYVYNRVHTVVAVSEVIKEDLINRYHIKESKIKVIYNPYDIETLRTLYNVKRDDFEDVYNNNSVFVTCGRLCYQKGQSYLIDAFEKVVKVKQNVVLLIFGEGKLKKKLTDKIKSLNLENNIYLMGYSENQFKYYKGAKAFILSSLFEGFPNTLVEAMICELPVVSTDCKSGPREILYPKSDYDMILKEITYATYGIITPDLNIKNNKFNISLLSKAIMELIDDTLLQQKYSRLSFDRGNHFNYNDIIVNWREIFEN